MSASKMIRLRGCVKNVGTQTKEKEDTNMCAFIDVSMDCKICHINCFHCDETFLIAFWPDFLQHIKDEHYSEEKIFAQSLEATNDNFNTPIEFEDTPNMAPIFQMDQIIIKNESSRQSEEDCMDVEYLEENTMETMDENCSSAVIEYESNSNLITSTPETITALNTFEIPWHKLPSKILSLLHEKRPLGGMLSKFTNFIVNEMRCISKCIPMGAFRLIAEEAIAKYPESFVERDSDGNIFSQGKLHLVTKLRNRNNFLNVERKVQQAQGMRKEAKALQIFRESCANWEPMEKGHLNAKDIEEMELKKHALILLYKENNFDAHKQLILNQMKETFALQRHFINETFWNDAAIKNIICEWPFLFNNYECLKQHFDELMAFDSNSFVRNYEKTKNRLKLYLKSLKLLQPTENTYDEEIFKSIAAYFNEDLSLLYHKYKIGTSLADVTENLNVKTPFMAYITDTNDQQTRVYVLVDSELIMTLDEDTISFVQLLSLLIQIFYTLNIRYPKDVSQTLEFCVKYFFKHYCDVVRGSKRHINNIHKVNTFCKRISSFKIDTNETPLDIETEENTMPVKQQKELESSQTAKPNEAQSLVMSYIDDSASNFTTLNESVLPDHKRNKSPKLEIDKEHNISLQNVEMPTTSRSCAQSSTPTIVGSAAANESPMSTVFTVTEYVNKAPSTYYNQMSAPITSNSEALFYSFRVPWHKISRRILNCCHKRKPIGALLTAFAVSVIDELRVISKHIPLSVYRAIAKQATDKYPDTFMERDHEGNITSRGGLTLITKLRNRNNFLNRKRSKKGIKVMETTFVQPISVSRQLDIFRKSCTNWQPTDACSFDEETLQAMTQKKEYLLRLHKQEENLEAAQKQTIWSLMKDTFPLQRLYINQSFASSTPVQNVLSEWPFLFSEDCLNQHFDELLSIDSYCIETNYLGSKNLIVAYLTSLKNSDQNCDYTNDEDVLNGIAAYFGEDLSFLYKKFKCDTNLEDIKENLTIQTPFMAVVPDEQEQFGSIYIFVEKIMVMSLKQNNLTFLSLVALIVKLYYTLNVFYPKEVSQTLEFFVKFFCKYYCDTPRGSKKGINSMQKVHTLVKRISNYFNKEQEKERENLMNIQKTPLPTLANAGANLMNIQKTPTLNKKLSTLGNAGASRQQRSKGIGRYATHAGSTEHTFRNFTENSYLNAENSHCNFDITTVSRENDCATEIIEPSTSCVQKHNNNTNQSTQVLLENFLIPWHKLPNNILNTLETRQKLGRLLKYFVEYVVDEVRAISKHVPLSVFRSIAKQATEKYPISFLECDSDGHIISYQNLNLVTKLQNRNNALNRANVTSSKEDDDDFNLTNAPFYSKRLDIFRKSAPNWQPEEQMTKEKMNELKMKKFCLLEYYKRNGKAENEENISTFMRETFAMQRAFINKLFKMNSAPIQALIDEWPFLFDEDFLNQHFEQLMAVDAKSFESNFARSKQKVIAFLKTLKNQSDYTSEENIFTGIATYFSEDLSLLHREYNSDMTLDSITKNLTTAAPFAAKIKNNNGEIKCIYIFVERVLVMIIHDKDYRFSRLIALLIKLFYMLNLFYPKEVSQTLEFCVKFFFKHFCDVTRGLKRNINNLQKVNNLTKRIAKIKTDDDDEMQAEDSRSSFDDNESQFKGFDRLEDGSTTCVTTDKNIKSEISNKMPDVGEIKKENEIQNVIDEILMESEEPFEEFPMENPTQSSRSVAAKKNDDIPIQFQSFRIPWERLPASTANCLNTKAPMGTHLSHFTGIIIDELRCISTRIPASVYRSIADEAISKYPASFSECDSSKLINKLRSRNNHLNNTKNNHNDTDNSTLAGKRTRILSIDDSVAGYEIYELTTDPNVSNEADFRECYESNDEPTAAASSLYHKANQLVAPSTFKDFQIPWEKLPSQILHRCARKQKLDRYLTHEFIAFVVDELRFISKHIPLSVFRAVTKQATDKYPATFLEQDSEGHIISTQNLSLLAKLRNRNNFQNRPKSTNTSGASSTKEQTAASAKDEISAGIQHKKRCFTFSKICPNWQPEYDDVGDTINELRLHKNRLLEFHQQGCSIDSNKSLILSLMKKTFPLQRTLINKTTAKNSQIFDVISEWPYLFNEECLTQHFEELMSFDSSSFEANYLSAKCRIIAFLRTLKNQNNQCDYTNDEEILTAIAAYFSEDISLLYKKYECGTKLDDIKGKLKATTPFLAAIQNASTENFDIYVIIDKIVVITMKYVKFNLISLTSLLIKLFYVLNIWYPKDITQTLEFCVKFFHKHYCDITRGLKKNINSIQKVNNLINRISNMQIDTLTTV